MVAAGATVLMATSEGTSNKTQNNSTQYENHNICCHYNEVHNNQQNSECSIKKNITSCNINKNKSRNPMLEKNSRLISRSENKESSKNLTLYKTAPVRETKASRLRAASIISPNGGTVLSRRLGMSENSTPLGHQPSTSLSIKDEHPISSNSSITNSPRERDKSYKRKSYLNRSLNMETATGDRSNQSECNIRQTRRQSNKQGYISDTISTSYSSNQHQATNLSKKPFDSKITCPKVKENCPKTYTLPSLNSLANSKHSNIQRTSSGGHSDSEVSRRVDALTALTKSAIERVERLKSQSNLPTNYGLRLENRSSNIPCQVTENSTNNTRALQLSPRKSSILKKSNDEHSQDGSLSHQHTPVSILKHKMSDIDTGQNISTIVNHTVLPVTFSPSVRELTHKKHGILKKRSSLDESEILRRRSCSPDISSTDNTYSEFRPILKNQRRSSLDEIIKRDQSPDLQPTSILKRKSSREDDREDRQVGSAEPQGILKRKSTNSQRMTTVNHHVTITMDATNVTGPEILDSSEVRPILKKKHSREESFGSDPPSLEPRPILKKKSSTESDEHDDKPKKTILKCTRKNSQDECNYETELTSPKKLSMLRNRTLQNRTSGVLENDAVRPILKQPGNRDNESRVRLNLYDETVISDDICTEPTNLFLRKRAQSVGHIQPSNIPNEFIGVLNKRRSLELISVGAISEEKSQVKLTTSNIYLKAAPSLDDESAKTSIIPCDKLYSTTKEKFTDKEKQTVIVFENKEGNKVISDGPVDNNIDNSTSVSIRMSDKEGSNNEMLCVQKKADDGNIQENNSVHRSNSVSKMTLHFKTLHEKANSKEKDGMSQKTPNKGSHGVQRYRDRKNQGNDRFNTQPITFQEVQEAVLQNQRNVTSVKKSSLAETTTDDEFDPSKLSLAERVRLFNQKIDTEKSSVSNTMPLERHSRRRPAARYKTQPVTSEEVEVASRISPLNSINQCSLDTSDLPKSILKPVALQAHNSLQTKSLELEGMKLIKSVLKKESEELEQRTSESCDVSSRFKLKPNLKLEENKAGSIMENNYPTQYGLSCAYSEKDNHIEGRQHKIKQKYTVPFHKYSTQDELNRTKIKSALNNIDNVQTVIATSKKYEETLQTSGGETFSVSHETCNIKAEAASPYRHPIFSKQTRCTSLSKSVSHHAISNKTNECESNSAIIPKHGVHLPELCRSATQAIPTIDTNDGPSMSIAERLAALQRSGNTNWKRRIASESSNSVDGVCSNSLNKEELSIKQGVLADCLGKLESATEGWKKRIAAPDVTKFTVAGKMKVEQLENVDPGSSSPLIEATGNIIDRKKKTPRPERFRAKKGYMKDAVSTPTSPNKDSCIKLRGSFSEPASDDSAEEVKMAKNVSPVVSVPKIDDETFTSFFTGISLEKCEAESVDLNESDFDMITSQSELLVQKRNIRLKRRRFVSRNPLKTLAARTDLKSEYTEIRTGIAEKVMKQLNVEKLAKNSSLAMEALAGLASTEDFSNITLRNVTDTNISSNRLQPYKDLMLILIKGRRHVQVRLVEPVAESINSGDNFVLVTKSEVYNYIGKYCNVIEKARGAEIALSIQQNKDLGCQTFQVITINEDKLTCTKSQLQKFWSYLGAENENVDVIEGGHPDEDELYETFMIDTNMVYEIKDEELVPLEKYWGTIPKIEMLDPNKVLVFDFGSEMYIWSGKGASTDKKKLATHLATEMWQEGYDYSECTVCPISAASMIGRRTVSKIDLKSAKVRPKWCLLAKLTQHVETILFREKFLDWPNVSRIIRIRGTKSKENVDGTVTIEVCNINNLLEENTIPVDLVLEGTHLGRGTGWYDDEQMKQFIVTTMGIKVWHIDEFSHSLLDDSSVGQFHSADSYIVYWMYSVTVTGRELSGLPSKHSAKGRDRSVYFIWQGQNASLNEQGAAALLTIELDNDQAPQIRVVQGYEPAAFLNLFSGGMIVHSGKKTNIKCDERWRLYICRGTLESEVSLIEIPCSTRQLRSRGSLILLDTKNNKIYIWHGSNSLPHIKQHAVNAAAKLKKNRPQETGLTSEGDIEIFEIDEGMEPEEFINALGQMNKKLYVSLEKDQLQEHTPRLFHLSSISKEFKSVEMLCPHRASLPTPFPFLQEDLYQVHQPALFLLDNKNELWIWQGWWPNTGAEDQSGSKAVRWQAERRAAMTMAMQYWQRIHPETNKYPIYLVWAGLEPLQFINLFPTWTYRDDIAELNIEDGRNPGEVLTVESELIRLTQSTYPPAQLLQRPLPEGVDPTHLELYLSQQHFQEILGMTKEEFQELPVWRQVNLKKEIGLF
ncbi:supervillin isoform X1 [Bombus vosnesenskii]|uniref:Supervillin isoform X1 n=1 Tax=Bombus vosnesenskii TaxID=207650 RepID=A0A6J3LN84_9HYME|nr:supervillin isoform X1 [Bombus vosnesenskii]XP_033366953.1 supervillin isoform X1 [Bombus vosnesenskii]